MSGQRVDIIFVFTGGVVVSAGGDGVGGGAGTGCLHCFISERKH